MRLTKLDRRALLRTLGAGAALAPFLPLLDRDARAQSGFPKRLVLWFFPTGSVLSQWRPTGGETDFVLSEILKPLEPWRSRLLVVDGVSHVAGGSALGNHPHGQGMSWCWTASWPGKDGPAQDSPIKGTSVDQYVASRVGAMSKFKSLQLGVTSGQVGTGDSARYASMVNYARVPNEISPYAVYDRLFKDLMPGTSAPDTSAFDKLRAQRKSIMDLVRAEITALSPKLGADERQKLDAHLTGLREMEGRLQNPAAGAGTAGCQQPVLPSGRLEVNTTWNNMPTLGAMQMDFAAAALACDLTRVVNLQWACGYPQNHYPFLNVDVHHHQTSHQGTNNATATRQLVTINNWYSQQLASFLERLSKIKEGSGSVLDNTLILTSSEIATSGTHDWKAMPFLIAGNAGGALRTGRYLKTTGGTSNRLFVSICHAMGLTDVQRFGDTDTGSGPLGGLT